VTKYTHALMPVALFGITNSGLSLFVNLLILFLVVVWLALIAWTYLDARRRISDPVLIACATGASLFPFVGTIIYAILRPPEFIEDARERDLEIRASQLRVRQLQEQSCPNCEFPIERTYLRCPNCRVRVKDPCASCGKPIDPRWTLCPYCETPVRRAEPTPRRTAAGTRAERTPSRSPAPEGTPSASRPRKPAERPTRTAAASDRASASRPPTRSSASRPGSGDRAPTRSGNSTSSTSSAPRSARREPSGDRPAAPASES
jgi:double zinc ribbon protein